MFTSRAEHRLLFNHGSSEIRYFSSISDLNLLSPSRKSLIRNKIKSVQYWVEQLNTIKVSGSKSIGDMLRSQNIVDLPPDLFLYPNPFAMRFCIKLSMRVISSVRFQILRNLKKSRTQLFLPTSLMKKFQVLEMNQLKSYLKSTQVHLGRLHVFQGLTHQI